MLLLKITFIDVSNNLPQTSYMILHFLVVLIHTHMDTLRQDQSQHREEDMMRENKVGKEKCL